MAKRDIEDIYPLSPMQQGMLFHTLVAPETGMYFEQTTWKIRGKFDEPAFHRAWQEVVRRHAVLRSAFVWEEIQEPLQVVFRDVNFSIESLDWSGVSAHEQEARLAEFLRRDRVNGFDLAQAPLMRGTLIRLGQEEYDLVWSHHAYHDRRTFGELPGLPRRSIPSSASLPTLS
jgi:surfactin family lipopeptide synthetase C